MVGGFHPKKKRKRACWYNLLRPQDLLFPVCVCVLYAQHSIPAAAAAVFFCLFHFIHFLAFVKWKRKQEENGECSKRKRLYPFSGVRIEEESEKNKKNI